MFCDKSNPNHTSKHANSPTSTYQNQNPNSPNPMNFINNKNNVNKMSAKKIEIGMKALKLNEEIYLSEISTTREEEYKAKKNRKIVDATLFETKIEEMEAVVIPKVRDTSPATLNLPQLYEDVSSNNRLLKMKAKSQRDLNFNFKQFWPVSKNFKISQKPTEDEQFKPSEINDPTKIDQNDKPLSQEKKRPITGASSNVNKYEIDFNEYNSYSATMNKNKTLVHLYEHNTNFE